MQGETGSSEQNSKQADKEQALLSFLFKKGRHLLEALGNKDRPVAPYLPRSKASTCPAELLLQVLTATL